jgi:hypothetical protein
MHPEGSAADRDVRGAVPVAAFGVAEFEAAMTLAVPHPQDIVRVHPGVMVDGRNLGGMHLTVTATVTLIELDATEFAGGKPIHLLSSQVDVVHHYGGIR